MDMDFIDALNEHDRVLWYSYDNYDEDDDDYEYEYEEDEWE